MKAHELNNKSKLFESELISQLLLQPEKSLRASQIVSVQDFYYFSKAFEITVDCYLNDKNVPSQFSDAGLKVSDFLAISTRNIETVCYDLKEVSNARKIFSVLETSLEKISHVDTESFVSEIQQNLIGVISKKEIEDSNVSNIIQEYKKLQDFYIQRFKNGNEIIGISTGYVKLDEAIDGFRPEHFWVIGGYTNMGKSFASLNLMANLIRQGKRVVFYSVEMGKHDILSRLLGILTKQNGISILKGFVKNGIDDAFSLIEKSNSAIYSDKAELSDILLSMYEENLRKKVDLFIVDFIQIVTVKNTRSEYEQVTTSVLELQQIAKRLKVPIIGLSQISNEGAKNNDQDLMTFKGSGAIAAAADFAIEIVFDEEDKKIRNEKMKNGEPVYMKWKIRKNRHGRTGYMPMIFNGKDGTFEFVREKTEEELKAKNTDVW